MRRVKRLCWLFFVMVALFPSNLLGDCTTIFTSQSHGDHTDCCMLIYCSSATGVRYYDAGCLPWNIVT